MKENWREWLKYLLCLCLLFIALLLLRSYIICDLSSGFVCRLFLLAHFSILFNLMLFSVCILSNSIDIQSVLSFPILCNKWVSINMHHVPFVTQYSFFFLLYSGLSQIFFPAFWLDFLILCFANDRAIPNFSTLYLCLAVIWAWAFLFFLPLLLFSVYFTQICAMPSYETFMCREH